MKRTEIQRLLPSVFQRSVRQGNPLSALLEVMEALHEPAEEILLNLDKNFDPYRAPDAFVPYLTRWVDLEWLLDDEMGRRDQEPSFDPLPAGIGHLREVLAAAWRIAQNRGTAGGLLHFLETATGIAGFQIQEEVDDDQGRRIPFHILVIASAAARPQEDLIHRIISFEKPAYVTYELKFKGSQAKKKPEEEVENA